MDVQRAWATAADQLNIEVITPFRFSYESQSVACVAFLPHFGSLNGMIVALLLGYEIDKRVSQYTDNNSMYCSYLNPEAYATFDEQKYQEALADWGYFGPPEKRPHWLDRATAELAREYAGHKE